MRSPGDNFYDSRLLEFALTLIANTGAGKDYSFLAGLVMPLCPPPAAPSILGVSLRFHLSEDACQNSLAAMYSLSC